jgi:hypothetical protein
MEMYTQENQTKITQEEGGYEIDMEEVEKQPKLRDQDPGEPKTKFEHTAQISCSQEMT